MTLSLLPAYHEEAMEPNTPDWEISKLYSQAFAAVKKNKLLWVLGLAVAGSGFSYRDISNFNSQDFSKLLQNNPNTPHSLNPDSLNNVLGAATSPFSESIKAILASVPFYLYLLLGLEFLVLIIVSIIISIIYRAWTQGLLLQSSFDAAEDKKVSIEDASAKILPKIKPLIWLNIVPGLVFTLSAALSLAVLAILTAFVPGGFKIITIILIAIALGAAIYWGIRLSLVQIWAPRKVLMEKLGGKQAFFSSLNIVRRKFWPSLLLGLVNNILALFIIGIPIGIIIGLVVGSILAAKFAPGIGFVLIILAIPLFLAGIIGFSLLSGALNGFKTVVWTLAYKQIKGKYD